MARGVVEAAAWAIRVVEATVVVAVVFAMVVVVVVDFIVVVTIVGAGVVRVVVEGTGELACWSKVGQAASPTGLCPCPSLAVGDNAHSPCLFPLLLRNRKNLEVNNHMPKSLT